MAQQTAVDWLANEISTKVGTNDLLDDLYKQAKAIEKEQIKEAYWNGTSDMEKPDALLMAEDYFNQYYKK
jgi:hypothetical protein